MIFVLPDVPFISQLGRYPTGCESVSAVMVLSRLGIPIDPDTFISQYLPKGPAPAPDETGRMCGPDPWERFPGDPFSSDGWGCFAPALTKAVRTCLDAYGFSRYLVREAYGKTLPELISDYLSKNLPVIFWATIGMAEPRKTLCWETETGRQIQWISPMHCTVLIGYQTDDAGEVTHYIFNDPTSGEKAFFPAADVQRAYEAQGEQSLVIEARSK